MCVDRYINKMTFTMEWDNFDESLFCFYFSKKVHQGLLLPCTSTQNIKPKMDLAIAPFLGIDEKRYFYVMIATLW